MSCWWIVLPLLLFRATEEGNLVLDVGTEGRDVKFSLGSRQNSVNLLEKLILYVAETSRKEREALEAELEVATDSEVIWADMALQADYISRLANLSASVTLQLEQLEKANQAAVGKR